MASAPVIRSGPEDGGNYEHHWAGEFLEAHLLSDVGKKRSHNEDSCLLTAPSDPHVAERRGFLFAVADGMGGVNGGGFASRISLQTLTEDYFSRNNGTIPQGLGHAVERANRRIYDEAENHPEYYGMGTTVSALLVQGGHAYIAQVGDSRVYLKRGHERLFQITEDHSLVAEQLKSGQISEEEARTHSLKNLITRAVGTKDTVEVDLFCVPLQRGDKLLLCSDGLSNVVVDEVISEQLESNRVEGAARVLVGRALTGGGPDNITAVIVEVTGELPREAREEGAQLVHPPRPGILSWLMGRLR